MSSLHKVTIEPPVLHPNAKGVALAGLICFAARGAVVWGVIAILMPWFGIHYWMVLLALIGLSAVRGPQPYTLTRSANRVAEKATERVTGVADMEAQDEALLVARSMS